jgi:hypothetical protein
VFSHLRGRQRLYRFRRRGLAGVRVEFALHAMAYNVSRVLALLGRTFYRTSCWRRRAQPCECLSWKMGYTGSRRMSSRPGSYPTQPVKQIFWFYDGLPSARVRKPP